MLVLAAQTEIVLKGVVRAERLPDPTEFVTPILERIKFEHVVKTYGIPDWEVRSDATTLAQVQGSGRRAFARMR